MRTAKSTCAESTDDAFIGCGDVCTIWRCRPGYHDCNGIVADGCEVVTTTDEKNCERYDVVCPAGTTCQGGQCHP